MNETVLPVILIEDHPLFRDALRRVVESSGEFRVVGTYGSAAELFDHAPEDPPALAVLDLFLPDGDGIRVLRDVHAAWPEVRSVILTAYRDEWNVERARRAGVAAFLDKTAEPAHILEALRTAGRGGTKFPRGRLLDDREDGTAAFRPDTGLFQLSAREREVARLIAAGCTNAQIAQTLFIAPGTVKLHVSRIYEKLGVRDRSQAIVFLLAHQRYL